MDTAAGNQAPPKSKPALEHRVWTAVGGACALGVLVSVGWILIGWPLPTRLWIVLALAAGCFFFGFIAIVIKRDLPSHLTRALAGGTGLVLLISAVVAVQGRDNPDNGTGDGVSPSSIPSQTDSDSSTASEPITASLKFNNSVTPCENFTIPKSFLPSIPKSENGNMDAGGLDAKWIYENGGATLSESELTIQGNTSDAVIIQRLRVVDLERKPIPPDPIGILPCGGSGGDMYPRSYEVVMSDPPKVRPRKVETAPVPEGVPTPDALDTELPIKVSNSDPEIFMLKVAGPECFCEWRLAIDWMSRGRSGTTVVDHGFGKIRSDTYDYQQRDVYWLQDGQWQK